MKISKRLFICLLLLTGCEVNSLPSNSGIISSINNVPSTIISEVTPSVKQDSTSELEEKRVVLEREFSMADSDPSFFQDGWYTVNSKFGTHSVILLEDETYPTGAGVLRTKGFEAISNIKVSLTFQVTGFNNAVNIDNFMGQTFKFGISLLNKENENIKQNAMVFEHLITKGDCENKCFSSLNPYTKNPSEAKVMDFIYTSEEPIEKIKIEYLSKPHYMSGTKDNGINLEIFALKISEF